MKNSYLPYYIFFWIILRSLMADTPELDIRLSGEAGLYQARDHIHAKGADFISRFSGQLKLQESTPSTLWNVSLQLKPEFYQGDFSYSALKLISRGQFQRQKKSLRLGVGFDARKYSYFSSTENPTFDFFKLEGLLSALTSQKFNLTISPAYYYRDLSTQKLDAFSGEFSIDIFPAPYVNLAAGAYLENFRLSAEIFPSFTASKQTNTGWRWGPEFTLNYLRKIYFNLRYILLWHQSDITYFPSYEQYLRLFISRQIVRNWMIFFIIDYFWNDIQLQNEKSGTLLYIPFENENHIDLKIEKLIQQNLFFSARIGYFKDNYILPGFLLEGWQALLGLELEY